MLNTLEKLNLGFNAMQQAVQKMVRVGNETNDFLHQLKTAYEEFKKIFRDLFRELVENKEELGDNKLVSKKILDQLALIDEWGKKMPELMNANVMIATQAQMDISLYENNLHNSFDTFVKQGLMNAKLLLENKKTMDKILALLECQCNTS